jgi:hypothetical protein
VDSGDGVRGGPIRQTFKATRAYGWLSAPYVARANHLMLPPTRMMHSCIAFIALTCLSPTVGLADTCVEGSLDASQVTAYEHVANRIWSRIEDLDYRFEQLAAIRSASLRTASPHHLWVSYHYSQGISWVPNPAYRPARKIAKTLKVFSPKDGIDMTLYLYEGAWPGQAVVSPIRIGEMKVVAFIDGAETPQVASLRQAVMEIIRSEQIRANKTSGANSKLC